MALEVQDADIFNSYPRAIVHMRTQVDRNRLGVVLGAGVGKPLGYPDWRDLIRRIAEDPRVSGTDLVDAEKAPSIQAQLLFGRFADHNRGKVQEFNDFGQWRILKAWWRDIVHDALYRDVSTEIPAESTYSQFAKVIRKSALTINYNFDDTLERLLLQLRTQGEQDESRGYETVTDARLQFQRDNAIIYHPNGFLPRNQFENPSDQIVLTEDSFGDQLIETMSGQYAALVNHLSKNTCLFIGLSLEDGTLRHLLRQHARMNPGHVHYYVRFVPGETPDDPTCRAEREANFDVFNFVTLFLNTAGLASLARLLVASEREIISLGERTAYCFYLSGAPGTGKTTTAAFLRSLITYDEWVDPRPASLSKPHADLNTEERVEVDEWIVNQIGKKNAQLAYESATKPVGIRIVDRCLTDPIAFSEEGQEAAKAKAIAVAIGKYHQRVQPGHVIWLDGDTPELVVRVKSQGKESSNAYTDSLRAAMRALYDGLPGVSHLELGGSTIEQVVKRVAKRIHLEDYSECDLESLLGRVEAGPTPTST